ncbi:MAG: hypothetical protein MJ070_05025 [Lachnospiraceae bacterium]|nr:hypothetical protein [Lachnospiraceae bacterium]
MKPITLKAGTDACFTVTDFLYYESEARAGCLRNTDITFTVGTASGTAEARRTFDIKEFRRLLKALEAFSAGDEASLRDPDHGVFLRFAAGENGTLTVSGETGEKAPFRLAGITASDLSVFVYRMNLLIPN